MFDGSIARATGNTSELGAKLDSVADMLYYAVMLVKILPHLVRRLPEWIWYVVALVIAIRVLSYVIAAVKYRRFASLHTYMNKLTGALIFTVPYFFYGEATFGFAISLSVCIVAGLASTEEVFIHLNARDYDPDRKHLISVSRQKQA